MGNIIELEDGGTVELVGDPKKSPKNGGALLGQGGQGSVYKVKTQDGKFKALKIYSSPMSNAFMDNIRNNIAKGAPNNSFLWPEHLIKPIGPNGDRNGYVMDLYDSQKYTSFNKIIMAKASFPTKELQIAALLDLVEAFEMLHARGQSYQDLNDGGVRFDCQNGKVLICDNDNVAPSGVNIPMDDKGHCIQGKFKFMAPEVAINMFKPDKHSDRFSLAVLIFMLLLHAHPFDGIKRFSTEQLTASLQEKLYGIEPVFIFHPTDTSNRPDPQADINAIKGWAILPDFIQALFVKTFTAGMPSIGKSREELTRERQGRTSEKEWREALHRWLDTISACPKCDHAICVPIQEDPAKGSYQLLPIKCPHCRRRVQVSRPILVIKKNDKVVRTIILEDAKIVPKSSVTTETTSNDPAFEVIRSPKNKDAFGLRNLLPYQWTCNQTGAKTRLVNTNGKVAALNGVHIEFDYTFSGEIYYFM